MFLLRLAHEKRTSRLDDGVVHPGLQVRAESPSSYALQPINSLKLHDNWFQLAKVSVTNSRSFIAVEL